MELRTKGARALSVRLLVALFVAATFSVSACAAACLGQHCAAAAGQARSTSGGQAAQEHHGHGDHSGTPANQDSERGDCSTHGHPGSYVKDRASLTMAPQLVWAVLPRAADGSAFPAAATLGSPEGRDHAPPSSQLPLYEKDCLLRI